VLRAHEAKVHRKQRGEDSLRLGLAFGIEVEDSESDDEQRHEHLQNAELRVAIVLNQLRHVVVRGQFSQ